MRSRCQVLGFAVLWMLCLASQAAAEIVVHDAWVAATPPGAPSTGAFMILQNDGPDAVRLLGAMSPAAARVELHRSSIVDGIARMRPLPELTIPAGEQRALAAGGDHLMLVGPKQLQSGDRIELRLHFAGGVEQTVEAVVRSHHAAHEH